MAIAFEAHLGTETQTGGGATYNFTVTAPTSGRVVLVFIGERRATTLNTLNSVSGLGLTWTQLAGTSQDLGATTLHGYIYAGTGTPNGTTTFTVAWANTDSACGISMSEYSGIDASTPASIDVQQDTTIEGGVTSLTGLSLGSAPSDATFAGCLLQTAGDITPNGAWTEIGENSNSSWRTQSVYDLAPGSQSYAPSWTGAATGVGVMIEVLSSAGADETITPSAVTIPITVPAPTVLADATITPSPVTIPITAPAPTVTHDTTITAAAVTVPIAVPTPTVDTGTTIEPAAVTIPITVPAPTVVHDTTLTPSAVTVPITVPSPTVVADVTITPAAVTVPIDVPTPVVTATATITPSAVTVPIAVPSPTVTATATITPDTITITITVPTPAVLTDTTITPAAVTIVIVIPTPTVRSVFLADLWFTFPWLGARWAVLGLERRWEATDRPGPRWRTLRAEGPRWRPGRLKRGPS